MYKIAQRSDAESKVPQFLLKLIAGASREAQVQTLMGLFYRENRDYAQADQIFPRGAEEIAGRLFRSLSTGASAGKAGWRSGAEGGARALCEIAAERIGASDLELKTRLLEEWGELLIDRAPAKTRDAQAGARMPRRRSGIV